MYKPPGGLYSEGRCNGGFLRYDFEGLIHGGAYFRNFTVYFCFAFRPQPALPRKLPSVFLVP